MTLTASSSATRSSGSDRSQSPRDSSRWTRYAIGVAVHAESRGRLGQARRRQHGGQRVDALALGVRPADQDRREELAGLADAVGEVADVAEQEVGGQPGRADDARRVGQEVGCLERGTRRGLGGRPRTRFAERTG